jgi:phage-related tail protein
VRVRGEYEYLVAWESSIKQELTVLAALQTERETALAKKLAKEQRLIEEEARSASGDLAPFAEEAMLAGKALASAEQKYETALRATSPQALLVLKHVAGIGTSALLWYAALSFIPPAAISILGSARGAIGVVGIGTPDEPLPMPSGSRGPTRCASRCWTPSRWPPRAPGPGSARGSGP